MPRTCRSALSRRAAYISPVPVFQAIRDEWTRHRGPHRSLPHRRDGHLADFVFCERGRRLGKHRLSNGPHAAVADAGLADRAGRPLHVTFTKLVTRSVLPAAVLEKPQP